MTSPITYPVDDTDLLDDAALWAVIDSAATASLSSKSRKPILSSLKQHRTPPPNPNKLRSLIDGEVVQQPPPKTARSCVSEISSSPLAVVQHVPRREMPNATPLLCRRFCPNADSEVSPSTLSRRGYGGEVVQQPPLKIARSCVSEISSSPMAVMKHLPGRETPNATPLSCRRFSLGADSEVSPSKLSYGGYGGGEDGRESSAMRHSLSGRFPSVPLFKEYQTAAMAILEKSDYTMISGNPYIRRTGWRKISCYFNISYEIKDKTIEFDENRNVQRAEFIIRAYMQGGRFSDGWGSCEKRERRFMKPNHDVPSIAETRAKNKACQDLLGIGEYRPGASHA